MRCKSDSSSEGHCHTLARVLLIPGADDWTVPPEQSQQVHEAGHHNTRRLVLDGVGHGSLLRSELERILAECVTWFRSG